MTTWLSRCTSALVFVESFVSYSKMTLGMFYVLVVGLVAELTFYR